MHKILWNFQMQTDYQLPARRPVLVLLYKKEKYCRQEYFAFPANHREEMKENEDGLVSLF